MTEQLKPFDLDAYKRDPSQLRFRDGSQVARSAYVERGGEKWIAVEFTFRPEAYKDVPNVWHFKLDYRSLALSTKYEVRRARPYRYHNGTTVGLAQACAFGDNLNWCGPEFEYQVEVDRTIDRSLSLM